jgi:ABC-type spermidine/putrescine transport system permease subunit II
MTSSGIILAVLIALIVAYAIARTRRRMGLMVSGKTWIAVIVGVVVVLLALWATQTH